MTAAALVLIVDDDPIQREFLAEWLSQAGYRTTTAADGDLGVREVEREQPAVVLTDMMMPNKDGIETVIELKRRWPVIPVIAMSSGMGGRNPEVILRAATALGADAALCKPIKRADLVAMVGGLIG